MFPKGKSEDSVVILRGKTNYIQWRREFKMKAKSKDLLRYICSDGGTPLMPLLDDPGYMPMNPAKVVAPVPNEKKALTTITTPEAAAQAEAIIGKAKKAWKEEVKIWKILKEEYNLQQKEVREAMDLIMDSVEDKIGQMIMYMTPPEAYAKLRVTFKIDDATNLTRLYSKLDDVSLAKSKTVGNLIEDLCNLVADIRSIGGDVHETQIKAKIIKTLTPEFHEVKRAIQHLEAGGHPLTLEQVIKHIQTFEVIFEEEKNDAKNGKIIWISLSIEIHLLAHPFVPQRNARMGVLSVISRFVKVRIMSLVVYFGKETHEHLSTVLNWFEFSSAWCFHVSWSQLEQLDAKLLCIQW